MFAKNILFVTHLFYPAFGGVETHLTRLARALVERGFQVKVLTTEAYSTEAFFLKDKRRIPKKMEIIDGVEIERLGFRTYGRILLNLLRSLACRLKYPVNSWVRFYSYGPRNSLFFKKIIEARPDIILAAPLPTFNIYYAWKAAKKLEVPLIVNPAYHIHDPCSFSNPIFFKIMRDAQIVAVHSEKEKDHIFQKIAGDSNKIMVFPPLPLEAKDLIPLDAPFSKADVKKKYGIQQNYVVLCLGQHGIHKNIAGVIKVMPHIWRSIPDVALVIAGGATVYTSKLKKMTDEIDESGNRRIYYIDDFHPDEKKGIYKMADIYISLSDFESFGIVFVEAMLHKLPIVASRNSIAASIVIDFFTGLLVDPHCEADISGAVIELLNDDGVREIYGENGRKKALEDYSPGEILSKWEKVLNSLI